MSKQLYVACKIPNGLILRLFQMKEESVTTPMGYMKVNIAREVGNRVKLNGPALPFGQMPNFALTNGYALTRVDEDFWEEWCKQNHDSDLLASGSIFAADSAEEAQVQALDQRKDGIVCGLEQVDPNNLPKGLSMRKDLKIETSEEMDKSMFRPVIDDTMRSAKNRSTTSGRVRRATTA